MIPRGNVEECRNSWKVLIFYKQEMCCCAEAEKAENELSNIGDEISDSTEASPDAEDDDKS